MEQRSPWRVVGVTPESKAAFEAVDEIVWFDEPDPTDEDPSGGLDPGRSFAASRTGDPPFAGISSWFDQRLTVPGPGGPRQVRSAGLTWVGVHPDERRRGVLTALLEHHLADVHAQGVPLGALHASETSIYGRFGYAQASFGVHVEVGGGAEVTAPEGLEDADVRTELASSDANDLAARVLAVQHAAAAAHVGHVTLTERHVGRILRRHPAAERDSEPRRVLFAVRGGVDVGYALVRRRHRWADSLPQGSLTCDALVTVHPAARFALLRRLVAFDLIGRVSLPADSVEDEVVWWLGGPRAVKARVHDALWLRIVDLPAALSLRGYAADVDVVLDVSDERCPWNAGRWRLRATAGSASCERTEDPADVALPVQALAGAYLGGRSLAEMARQGVVTGTADAVERLARAFVTTSPPAAALEF
ncbi:GNAT family N-acetyltransferase [Phycicoccus flavus]|uniref:GNAT family N-acetyltransferase n=1 Tax=Phycicoccus flavus TaxID=2502783 RepID=A0A8T6R192_9MICO|nr:GNAT family N-acetyltransferase [Phycicoccus flavus]NHA68098.1 GNAT family N-acetyltransferase [Phycicoccus flavus]